MTETHPPSGPQGEACLWCYFASQKTHECHRYPPDANGRRPPWRALDWCGEYRDVNPRMREGA